MDLAKQIYVSEVSYLQLTALFTKPPAPYSAIHKAAGSLQRYSQSCQPHGSRPFHDLPGTIPTMKPSMEERPLGVVPATSIFGNGR